jgi:hypothetical protein
MQQRFAKNMSGLLVGAALLCASVARADCADTVGLTPQEKDFYQRANAVLKSLLRPPPVADKLWSADSMSDPNGIEVCKSDKKPGNFTVVVSRKYVWPDPKGNMADAVVTLRLVINADKFDASDAKYSGAYGSPSPTRSAGLKVQNVVWALDGSSYGIAAQIETLRASLADGLERDRMEKLLGRPLPSVAESEALAKKAAPTKMLASAPAAAPASPSAAAQPVTQPAAQPAAPVTPAAAANTQVASPSPVLAAPEAPAAASPAEMVKSLGDSFQKLRGLLGQ